MACTSAGISPFDADYTAPGSSSRQAQDLLAERFPARSGEVVDVVVRADGSVTDPAVRGQVKELLATLSRVEHVRGVEDPYATPGAISPDGRTLLAHVQLDVVKPEDMPVERNIEMPDVAEAASSATLDVALGGQTAVIAQQSEIGSEGIGLIAAAIILLITFGSVVVPACPSSSPWWASPSAARSSCFSRL